MESPRDLSRSAESGDAVRLEPAESARSNAVILILFALFWNGIVAVFIVAGVASMLRKGFSWPTLLAGLFLVPFVLIGAFIALMAIHQLLSLLNPPLEASLDGPLRPGASATLRWGMRHAPRRMQRFRVMLEGVEIARYRKGTSTSTARHTFHRSMLVDTNDRGECADGRVGVSIPPGAMPTFQAANNRIQWQVHVHAELRRWPDLNVELPVEVAPPATGETST